METEMSTIRCGDVVKHWFDHAGKQFRVVAVRSHHDGTTTIHGVRANGNHVSMKLTSSLVVMFRPLTNEELFAVSEGIARDHTTGCLSCGAQWARQPDGSGWLDHRADCRYRRTLDEMPG